ncbi:GAF domain-containing protein [Akkermansiaceae bacterium]|nr:GAF domain-containing protein [Akkermansiaceae bacterium]
MKRYVAAKERILALCEGERDEVALMASVVGVLHHEMEGFLWTGFYRVIGDGLVIGPYQGPVGCLRIANGRGVCGTAASKQMTQVVPDVHAFPGHIACDSRSRSEIVVPVMDSGGKLIGVLDIDSKNPAHFNQGDQDALEDLLYCVFEK